MKIVRCKDLQNHVFEHYHYNGENENYIYLLAHELMATMPQKAFEARIPSSGKTKEYRAWDTKVRVNDIIADISNSDLELDIDMKCNGYIYLNLKAEVFVCEGITINLKPEDGFDIALLDKQWCSVRQELINWVGDANEVAQSNLRLLHDHQQALAEVG